MKGRCSPRNNNAKAQRNYIERGITVCDRWQSFEAFWEDMGPTYVAGLTLERVNNDKGYEPGNCVWATYAVQNSNKRTTHWIETPQGRMTVSQAAQAFGVNKETLSARIRVGRTGEDLFLPPHSMAGDGRRTRVR